MGNLETIIEEIKKTSWSICYQDYIQLYQKGLKKNAKTVLKEFIKEFKKQDKSNRRSFIDIIYKAAFLTENYNTFLPSNLYQEVVLPEIKDWINEEPDNPIPNRWSDDLNYNKKALQIDSTDQIALINFANRIIGKISMNQHEMSYGFSYDGNPNEDIHLINFFEKFVDNIQSIEKRDEISNTLLDLKNCALLFMKPK